MSKIRIDQLNDELYAGWGEQFGLKPHPDLFGNARSFRELLDKPDGKRLDEELLLDHCRYFVKMTDRSKVSAMVTAPYEKSVLSMFGDAGNAVEKIHELADRHGLRARVGHPADLTYVSAHLGDPTLPIVWWNPKRFQMPYPELKDPRPAFIERLL